MLGRRDHFFPTVLRLVPSAKPSFCIIDHRLRQYQSCSAVKISPISNLRIPERCARHRLGRSSSQFPGVLTDTLRHGTAVTDSTENGSQIVAGELRAHPSEVPVLTLASTPRLGPKGRTTFGPSPSANYFSVAPHHNSKGMSKSLLLLRQAAALKGSNPRHQEPINRQEPPYIPPGTTMQLAVLLYRRIQQC